MFPLWQEVAAKTRTSPSWSKPALHHRQLEHKVGSLGPLEAVPREPGSQHCQTAQTKHSKHLITHSLMCGKEKPQGQLAPSEGRGEPRCQPLTSDYELTSTALSVE